MSHRCKFNVEWAHEEQHMPYSPLPIKLHSALLLIMLHTGWEIWKHIIEKGW